MSRQKAERKARGGGPGIGSSIVAIVACLTAVAGATVLVYPAAASWLSDYNQSLLISDYDEVVENADPAKDVQLEQAREYNSELSAGAIYSANANVPTGDGVSSDDSFDYWSLLMPSNGIMSRLRIPSIDVDLPIYHGTGDETLLVGLGHLQGTSLPVGGEGTHTVITGHRGLASSTLFTNLDQVKVGDTFTLTTFGEVLTYRVESTRVVEPTDTASLLAEEGRDLVTLVTCTPLGINSHRILVTAERITPTPLEDVEAGLAPPEPLQFPWWLALYVVAVLGILVYLIVSLRSDHKRRKRARSAATPEQGPEATDT